MSVRVNPRITLSRQNSLSSRSSSQSHDNTTGVVAGAGSHIAAASTVVQSQPGCHLHSSTVGLLGGEAIKLKKLGTNGGYKDSNSGYGGGDEESITHAWDVDTEPYGVRMRNGKKTPKPSEMLLNLPLCWYFTTFFYKSYRFT